MGDEECNRNYEIIGSTIAGVFVIVSEIMPFVKNTKGNGIIHAVYQFYKSYTEKRQHGFPDIEAGTVATEPPASAPAPAGSAEQSTKSDPMTTSEYIADHQEDLTIEKKQKEICENSDIVY
jgi:hypothetical protein